mmetsp:Transcript_7005/g.19888  ORF Transcript_7005/g.19888 Transcript_7005/m.19888 type:complete len:136 (+) Transcript_7005:1115-1522(+)
MLRGSAWLALSARNEAAQVRNEPVGRRHLRADEALALRERPFAIRHARDSHACGDRMHEVHERVAFVEFGIPPPGHMDEVELRRMVKRPTSNTNSLSVYLRGMLLNIKVMPSLSPAVIAFIAVIVSSLLDAGTLG